MRTMGHRDVAVCLLRIDLVKPRLVRGFTLIELITSIIIIGILAAVVGPRFFAGSGVFSSRGYADEVASALRYAQAVAMSSGCDVSVTLTANKYLAAQRAAAPAALPQCATNGLWATPVVRVDGDALIGNAPSNVVLTPATQIVFDSQGHIANGAPPLLSIGTFTLSIDPLSGFVVVQ
jgi:MSHA pilin protein MshC